MKTGVFFHEIFARHSWPVVGNRFKNFPKAMERELQLEKVDLFKPEKVSEELLLKVHSREHLDRVKERWYYKGAAISVRGCIEASELVYDGKVENALVFNVASLGITQGMKMRGVEHIFPAQVHPSQICARKSSEIEDFWDTTTKLSGQEKN